MRIISRQQNGQIVYLLNLKVDLRVLPHIPWSREQWVNDVKAATKLTEDQAKSITQFLATLPEYNSALIVSHPAP